MKRQDVYDFLIKNKGKAFTAPEIAAALGATADPTLRVCHDLVSLGVAEEGPIAVRAARNARTYRAKGQVRQLAHLVLPKREKPPSHKRGQKTQHLARFLHAGIVSITTAR